MSKSLDFSGLNRIAHRGFEEQPEERDPLLEAGYTVVKEPVPFTEQPEASPPPPGPEARPEASPETMSGYKRLYRVAFDFHKRHSPPAVDLEYWHTRIPEVDETPEAELKYWREVAEDIGKTSAAEGNSPFLMDLLNAISAELEREYNALRDKA